MWSVQLHRFLLDHGGATVKTRVMSPDQAASPEFDVLLIDDICSFLTPRLVVDLRRAGKGVIGVFAPDDGPDAKRRLLEVGISDVIESDALPPEFLQQIDSVSFHGEQSNAPHSDSRPRGFCLAVTGPQGGVGITEVAVGIATHLRPNGVALVDLNQAWPSIDQRLGLPVHPNLRTAMDLVLHEPDRLDQSFHDLAGLHIVTGLVNPDAGTLSGSDAVTLISELALTHRHVIVDLGPITEGASGLLLERADATLVIGLADPIGVTRLIKAFERVVARGGSQAEVGVVLNRSRSNRQEDEIIAQLGRSLGDVPVFVIPEDSGLAAAVWDGGNLRRGPFARSAQRLASLFQDVGIR
jgi:MinD-like ATPase involved in chromosome partitioning or flagellar assembly